MKPILKLFSYIFHPLFTSVYVSVYYFYFNKEIFTLYSIFYFLTQVILLTIVLPLIMLYALISLRIITDVMVTNIKHRRFLLAAQCVYFFILCFHSLKPIKNFEIQYFFIGALSSTICALLAALFNKKVSLHMIGISGMACFLIGLSIKTTYPSLVLTCLVILLTGFVASSRLAMKAHTPSELIWGTCIGILSQVYLFNLWL